MVLSILLVILSSYSLKLTFNFFSKTKFSKLIIPVLVILLVIFLFSSVLPILSLAPSSLNTPSVEEVEALNWLKSNTEEDSSVLSRVEEGYIMNYFASRKNVMDPSFLFVSNINQRYSDINDLFSARLEIDALKLLTRYDVDYIYFSNRFKNQNDPDALFYASDPECFEPVYNQSILIYKVKCDLK